MDTLEATERTASLVAVGVLTSDELTERFEAWIRRQCGSPSEYRLFLLRVADREREAVEALAPDDPLRAACLDTARRLERDAGRADLRSVASLPEGGARINGAT